MPEVGSVWLSSLRRVLILWLAVTLFDVTFHLPGDSVAYSKPRFGAQAAETTAVQHLDLLQDNAGKLSTSVSGLGQETEDGSSGYEAEFMGLDRSILGRADQGVTALANNVFMNDNVIPGDTNQYSFSVSSSSRRRELDTEISNADQNDTSGRTQVEGRNNDQELEIERRASTDTTVYITINTCNQPDFASSDNAPQLTLFVSTSDSNTTPGPGSSGTAQQSQDLQQGFANITVNATGTVYIGVSGPSSDEISGAWNYELAASADQPYHYFNASLVSLYMIDSDQHSSLLISRNVSSATPTGQNSTDWLQDGPTLSIFMQNKVPSLSGMNASFCAWKQHALLSSDNAADDITTGLVSYGDHPIEQQFYVPNLLGQTYYTGILAASGDPNTPGGGGSIFGSATFRTKTYPNCQLLYNLSFCSSVAYSVPANPAIFPNYASLANLYDNTTATAYQNFNYSLQQIACNTTATAQYSLAKTCDDCAAAYKTWLCAVSIPRCADWNESASLPGDEGTYLMPRNAAQPPLTLTPSIEPVTNETLLMWLATNTSRNENIVTDQIMPGPYAEVLPCEDLCYNLVRSCPAALGFGCPYRGKGLEWSYGTRGAEGPDGGPTCSEPGAVWGVSAAGRGVGRVMMGVVVLWTTAVVSMVL